MVIYNLGAHSGHQKGLGSYQNTTLSLCLYIYVHNNIKLYLIPA